MVLLIGCIEIKFVKTTNRKSSKSFDYSRVFTKLLFYAYSSLKGFKLVLVSDLSYLVLEDKNNNDEFDFSSFLQSD